MQTALYNISEASHLTDSLPNLYRRIHEIIDGLLPAKNFYVALLDDANQQINFPYFVDEHDIPGPPMNLSDGSLTAEVVRTGKSLLLTLEEHKKRPDYEETLIGPESLDWLGVPLKAKDRVIGMLAVQSYSDQDVRYTEHHKNLLEFVSNQIASSIERKKTEKQLEEQSRIQKALYSISEANHSSTDLQDLFRRIHQIVSDLLPAQNFYVALYHEETQMLSFPYYIDAHDTTPPPIKIGTGGYTERVLLTGEALLLTPEKQAEKQKEGLQVIGTVSLDWLGVPLISQGRTLGVLTVQSYSGDVRYTEKDKELLQFVSAQVAATIDRKQQEAQLRQKNKIQAALYKISEASHSATDLQDLFGRIHQIVSELLPAKNFFVALYDEEKQEVSFPYYIDEHDPNPGPRKIGSGGLTEKILLTGEALLITPEQTADFASSSYHIIGTDSIDWLGVPLFSQGKPMGVLTVQSYTGDVRYSQHDKELLEFVSAQVASAIERKQSEEKLRLAIQTAEQASKAKSQFLANMSHEIRTPMNAILGMLKLLQNTELTSRQLDYVKKTEGAARSLLGLLNDILDFSKVEAGKMTLDPHPFNVDRLLRDLSVILSANVGTKDIEVLFDMDPSIPPILIGDDLRLQQVLINLGGNAIKFTAKGEVVIKVRAIQQTADAILVEFSVRDSGIGISAENQRHIFSGFSQAEASTTRRFGGTGLGLSISQRLVALMGGQLQLESQLGVGSHFFFQILLPIFKEPPSKPLHEEAKPLRALVVDDNATARDVLVSLVHSLGWAVDVASSGEEALAILEKETPEAYQAIFMDWQMPGMDGWEASMRIRSQSGIKDAPIVVMVTAHGREMLAQKSEAERELINGFLVKPVTASMLFDAVSDARSSIAFPKSKVANSLQNTERLKDMKILVVEDNLNNQQVALELLSAEGALVTIAGNGREGVDTLKAHPEDFEIVLMDIQMPIMDGYEATHEIRNTLKMESLPIVAMTANAMASDRDHCLASGMNDHVGKPFDLDHLVETLCKHTNRGEGSRPVVAKTYLPESLIAETTSWGIELETAVQRLGGNTVLYRRTIQNFMKDLAALPEEFEPLLSSQAWVDASRTMHTIKGTSATLGLTKLSLFAADAEGQLKSEVKPQAKTLLESLAKLIEELKPQMEHIAEAFKKLAQPQGEPTKSASSSSEYLRDLKKLTELLSMADMQAMDVFARIQKDYGTGNNDDLQPLDDAIMALDFATAKDYCEELIRNVTNRETTE
ncbi:MAG: GAF domain-containing protein [Acidobacteria bacterium]|nr:GAF domain-containing protein [Acidobacteriota bacterium]MCB9399581.1 GAF domain-containing protein [Acidobacteriota bacterium]